MDTCTQETYRYLRDKYSKSVIGKQDMAHELNISPSTLNLYISKGMICKYKKLGTAKNARVIFNIYDVAIYLNSGKIETI